jgi:UDP-glucose 4-epimerase
VSRALVTGAAGFVGANLALRLLREGHETHLLVRASSPPWRLEQLESEAEVHEADLEDATGVAAVVASVRPDWVFHLAARGAYSWQDDAGEIFRANFLGTANLLEACLATGFEAFVNAGSSSEYGAKDHAPAEDEPLEPSGPYALAKASATQLCSLMARREGARIVTLRLYSVYGPYEEPGRFVPALAVDGLQGRLPPLVSPRIARDFVYVDDVAEAFLLAAAGGAPKPGAVYNVGTGRQVTLGEAVAVARAALGIAAEPEWGSLEERPWDTEVWVSDPRTIRAELGWSARRSFAEGFGELVEWFRGRPQLLDFYEQGAARRR